MKHTSHISIPKPCAQNWDNMLPGDGSKFCNNCQKTVTDFTALTNAEILALLASSSGKVCGRLSQTQLLSLNQETAPQHSSLFRWKKLSLAAAFIAAVPFVRVQAKVKPAVEQSPGSFNADKLVPVQDTARVHKIITGLVTDTLGRALVGVLIKIKGTQIVAHTDINGHFGIKIPVTDSTILGVYYIGYKAEEVKIDPAKNSVYTFKLKEQNTAMGEILITKP